MAAIDRVIHHSVILDLMEVDSYRATEASKLQLSDRKEGDAAILISPGVPK